VEIFLNGYFSGTTDPFKKKIAGIFLGGLCTKPQA